MSEEEKNEEVTSDQESEEPAAEEETPETEAPAEDAPAEEAPAEEAPAEEAEVDEAPAEDAEAEPADESAAAEQAPADESEPLTPKQVRKLERSQFSGEAGPQLSPEERATQRAERRRGAAQGRRRHRASRRAKRGEPGTGTPPADRQPGARKVRQGKVVSSKPDKTITVRIEGARRHPTYEKVVRRGDTLRAHDERNEANEGDIVRVVETRPLSRTKRWRLLEILERAR
jgi:small subunit ribosomal protein S17